MSTMQKATIAAALLAAMFGSRAEAYVLLNTYNLGAGCLNAAAFNSATDQVWAKPCHGNFRTYDRNGVLQSTLTDTTVSDDSDFTFANEAVNINGTLVAAGSILYGNGDAPGGARLYGRDPTTGANLASIAAPNPGFSFNGNMVGAGYSATSNTFFLLSWTQDRVIEFDAATGTVVSNFTTGGYDVFYGDVEVEDATGNLLLVSDANTNLRVMTAAGAFVQDINLAALGITGASGLGLDQFRGELWISSTNGRLYQLGGFQPIPPTSAPAPGAIALIGLGLLGRGVLRRRAA